MLLRSACLGFSLCLFASAARSDAPDLLLSALLATIDSITASLINAAENLAHVKGDVFISSKLGADALAATIPALVQDRAYGAFSQAGNTVYASENQVLVLPAALLQTGDLATTAVGAIQTGALLGSTGTKATFDMSHMSKFMKQSVISEAGSAMAIVEAHGSTAQKLAMQSIAFNQGQVDGGMVFILQEVHATIGRMNTTAIGALSSGKLTAIVNGSLTIRH